MTKRLLERGKTSGRADDTADTIKKRLATFHKESDSILKEYKAKIVKIDANATADAVFEKARHEVDKVCTAAGIAVPK